MGMRQDSEIPKLVCLVGLLAPLVEGRPTLDDRFGCETTV